MTKDFTAADLQGAPALQGAEAPDITSLNGDPAPEGGIRQAIKNHYKAQKTRELLHKAFKPGSGSETLDKARRVVSKLSGKDGDPDIQACDASFTNPLPDNHATSFSTGGYFTTSERQPGYIASAALLQPQAVPPTRLGAWEQVPDQALLVAAAVLLVAGHSWGVIRWLLQRLRFTDALAIALLAVVVAKHQERALRQGWQHAQQAICHIQLLLDTLLLLNSMSADIHTMGIDVAKVRDYLAGVKGDLGALRGKVAWLPGKPVDVYPEPPSSPPPAVQPSSHSAPAFQAEDSDLPLTFGMGVS